MLVFYFLCYFLIFNFCFSYQVLILGHPEIVDHLFSCNGCQPVPRDCLIKICGVKLSTYCTYCVIFQQKFSDSHHMKKSRNMQEIFFQERIVTLFFLWINKWRNSIVGKRLFIGQWEYFFFVIIVWFFIENSHVTRFVARNCRCGRNTAKCCSITSISMRFQRGRG